MENNETNGVQTETQTIDYEKEFKALTDKYNSLNDNYMKKSDAFDKVSSEVADFKRQQRDNMTKEQQQAEELKEIIENNNKLKAEVKQMRLEKDLLANGFTADESEKLIKGNFAVKDIADIIKARLEASEKSIRAELIKNNTPTQPMGNGNTNTATQDSYAEKLAKSQFEGSDKLQKIKDLYKN